MARLVGAPLVGTLASAMPTGRAGTRPAPTKRVRLRLRCPELCKMEQTRAFAVSIMMFKGRVRRASSYLWRVDMGNMRKPRKESDKATLARIKKEMALPRLAKSARKGCEPD